MKKSNISGSISPVYGMATGKGLFGKLPAGVLGRKALSAVKDKKGAAPVKKMAKGGKVGRRGDGCCIKGHTKGKMV